MDLNSNFDHFLQKISQNPDKLILFAIKGRYPFATNLHPLDLSNCISVLILNSVFKNKIPPEHLNKFDFIHYFDGGEFWSSTGALSHLDELEFPPLCDCFDKIIRQLKNDQKFNINRLRLVAMEEQFVRVVAKIRDQYGIIGAKPQDVDRFTDKASMKKFAKENGISLTDYLIFAPEEMKSNDRKKKELGDLLGYPIMFKPLHGVGASGITKIDNPTQLDQWLNNHPQPQMQYLAEEYIDGTEYHVVALVQANTIQLFPSMFKVYGSSIFDAIQDQVPLCNQFELDPQKRQIVEQFVNDTLKIFQPHPGGLAFMQSFMTKNGQMKISEIAYRVPGMIGSVMSTENSGGISVEAVQLMAQIKEIDLREIIDTVGQKRKKYFANLAYPKRNGVVKKVEPLDRSKLSGDTEISYGVKPGDKIAAATNVGDMAVRIFLWNDDGEKLVNDCDWLIEHYHPLVLEDGQ